MRYWISLLILLALTIACGKSNPALEKTSDFLEQSCPDHSPLEESYMVFGEGDPKNLNNVDYVSFDARYQGSIVSGRVIFEHGEPSRVEWDFE